MNPLAALPQVSSAKLIGYALAILAAMAGVLWLQHHWQQQGAQACEAKAAAADAQRAREEADSAREAQRLQQQTADRRQEIEDAKDRRIRAVSAQLADALERLRDRPERLPEASRAACAGATGAELAAPDAGFLARYAALARRIQLDLDACQQREHAGVGR